jgi:hypothetical protein
LFPVSAALKKADEAELWKRMGIEPKTGATLAVRRYILVRMDESMLIFTSLNCSTGVSRKMGK